MAELPKRPRIESTVSNPELCKVLKARKDDLKLKMDDISKAAEKVNEVIDKIITSEPIRKHPLFKSMEKLSTGSYYEGVKLSRPNEFDIMLKITFECNQNIELTSIDDSGAFYMLAFKQQKPPSIAKYIDNGGILLAQRILDDFRILVEEVLPSSAASLKNREPSSPAVTLTITNKPEDISVDLVLALEVQQWPKKASGGMKIDSWLGQEKKQEYRKKPYYMVAKKPSQERKNNDNTWRISFSNIEKDIMNNHHEREKTNCQETKCCRKACLKLMKDLLEKLKKRGTIRMHEFISYHAKTALLHTCTKYPSDEDWKMEELDVCFNRYVEFFQECLKNYSLLNFFIPSHNLFSKDNIPEESCDKLFKALEDQKTNGYPIFSGLKVHSGVAMATALPYTNSSCPIPPQTAVDYTNQPYTTTSYPIPSPTPTQFGLYPPNMSYLTPNCCILPQPAPYYTNPLIQTYPIPDQSALCPTNMSYTASTYPIPPNLPYAQYHTNLPYAQYHTNLPYAQYHTNLPYTTPP